MNKGKKYKTKQREMIRNCFREHKEDYVTIQQISSYLKENDNKVGLTTIYRTLEKLETEKEIASVMIDGVNGTCYRYLPQKSDSVLFYLKCQICGKIVNIKCSELEHLYSHVTQEHHVFINPGKTLFYGQCEQCRTHA